MPTPPRARLGESIRIGVIAGILAGIVFAMFEMVMAAVMEQGFFAPLRMIGAIVLGEGALEPSYSVATAAPVGLVVHLAMSALYGGVFAVAAAVLRLTGAALVAAATLYGLVLWLVNFFVIAPVLFPWFGMADDVVQFVAHVFFFGSVLGLVTAPRLAS